MKTIKAFILKLVKKHYLTPHAFVAPDLIRRKLNTRSLYEVEMIAYTKDLVPIIFARHIGTNSLVSITGNDHHDYEEHKTAAPGSKTYDMDQAIAQEEKLSRAKK